MSVVPIDNMNKPEPPKEEELPPPSGSWADVAFLLAKECPDDVDWDAWKDEMKEADLDLQ